MPARRLIVRVSTRWRPPMRTKRRTTRDRFVSDTVSTPRRAAARRTCGAASTTAAEAGSSLASRRSGATL
jgi:hypothetical protein